MSEAVEPSAWQRRFAEVAEQMGAALGSWRRWSCALCDGAGRVVAESVDVASQQGGISLAVQAAMAALPMRDGEVAILNDPYSGGARLPDVTLVSAVDSVDPASGEVARFHLACRVRHSDVGGLVPGSLVVAVRAAPGELPEADSLVIAMGPKYHLGRSAGGRGAITIEDEGLRVTPRLLTTDVAHWFCAASRTPAERRDDLAAQQAALAVGRRCLLALAAEHGAEVARAHAAALRAHAAHAMQRALREIPEGAYAFADSLDDDGAGREQVGVRARIELAGGHATVDFSDSDEETGGAVNATLPVTLAAVQHCFARLCPAGTPSNDGLLDAITVVAPEGSIVNARSPRAVAGSEETAERIADVVLGALAQALPDRIAAAGAGTRSRVVIAGVDAGGAPFVFSQAIPGGAGAAASADATAINRDPIGSEWVAAEQRGAPFRVIADQARRGSGGLGMRNGGDGLERVIELLGPATITLVGERRVRPPYGLAGGGPGALGEDLLSRAGRTVRLPAKCTFDGQAGDRLTIRTPGGGGWGDPRRKVLPQ